MTRAPGHVPLSEMNRSSDSSSGSRPTIRSTPWDVGLSLLAASVNGRQEFAAHLQVDLDLASDDVDGVVAHGVLGRTAHERTACHTDRRLIES